MTECVFCESKDGGEALYKDILCHCGHPVGNHVLGHPHHCRVGGIRPFSEDCQCTEVFPENKQLAL